MFNWLTANGCFADADGKLEWVVPDDEGVRFDEQSQARTLDFKRFPSGDVLVRYGRAAASS